MLAVHDGEVWVMMNCGWLLSVGDCEVWVMVKTWVARPPREREQWFFSGFPLMQRGMFVVLCKTFFNYCNYNLYEYIFICGPYIHIFLVWNFMPKNRKFNYSVWLILYSKPLDLNAWNGIRIHYALIVVPKFIYYFLVLNYGPKDWSVLQYWECQNPV